MYIVLILVLTIVAPLVSGFITGSATGWEGGALHIFGMAWVFWGIGIRLFAAGISQIVRPEFTAKKILNIDAPPQIVQELGFMNFAVGLAGIISQSVPAWAPAIGLAGGGFLLLAGIRHIVKTDKNAKEWTACLTDIVVGVIGVAFGVGSLFGIA